MLEEISQYMKENAYSKTNIIKVLREEQEYFDEYLIEIMGKINKYLHGSYWDSKMDYITAICLTDISVSDMANHIIFISMKYSNTSIQNIAYDLSTLFDKYIDDQFIRIQIGADLAYVCRGITYKLTKKESILFETKLELSDRTKSLISNYIYQPPMLCKPLHISNNHQSGYLTYNDSVILGGKEKSHNKLLRLDVINIQNNIGFVLDNEVIKHKEKSKKVLKKQDLENFNQFVKECGWLHEEYKDRTFYFNWRYDSRGRAYTSGYHINIQSTEYRKASISLAKKELLRE